MADTPRKADFLDDQNVLVTGGTGSFGKKFIRTILNETKVRRVVVFSRDELKQFEMQQVLSDERLRYFIGDVRDHSRLLRAFEGVDIVVHAAALKQIPAAEYNPFEAVKTNILGAQNIIEAAIDRDVKQVLALSTDKASSPVNLYGATKLVSDKLFVAGNAYAAGKRTRMGVVRYGNVMGSRGSVIPYFKKLAGSGKVPITDPRMTRFWITLEQGVDLVRTSLSSMHGGEIFVPKLPSMKVTELAELLCPNDKIEIVGIRPGEKLHEEMISVTSARQTVDMGGHYVIQPEMEWWPQGSLTGKQCPADFCYSSETNDVWLSKDQMSQMLKSLDAAD